MGGETGAVDRWKRCAAVVSIYLLWGQTVQRSNPAFIGNKSRLHTHNTYLLSCGVIVGWFISNDCGTWISSRIEGVTAQGHKAGRKKKEYLKCWIFYEYVGVRCAQRHCNCTFHFSEELLVCAKIDYGGIIIMQKGSSNY